MLMSSRHNTIIDTETFAYSTDYVKEGSFFEKSSY
jgi:hypothetical protein